MRWRMKKSKNFLTWSKLVWTSLFENKRSSTFTGASRTRRLNMTKLCCREECTWKVWLFTCANSLAAKVKVISVAWEETRLLTTSGLQLKTQNSYSKLLDHTFLQHTDLSKNGKKNSKQEKQKVLNRTSFNLLLERRTIFFERTVVTQSVKLSTRKCWTEIENCNSHGGQGKLKGILTRDEVIVWMYLAWGRWVIWGNVIARVWDHSLYVVDQILLQAWSQPYMGGEPGGYVGSNEDLEICNAGSNWSAGTFSYTSKLPWAASPCELPKRSKFCCIQCRQHMNRWWIDMQPDLSLDRPRSCNISLTPDARRLQTIPDQETNNELKKNYRQNLFSNQFLHSLFEKIQYRAG